MRRDTIHGSKTSMPIHSSTANRRILRLFPHRDTRRIKFRLIISGLPPLHRVHLLAQGSKRIWREHRLHWQLEKTADLECKLQRRRVVSALEESDRLRIDAYLMRQSLPAQRPFRTQNSNAVIEHMRSPRQYCIAY